MSAKEISRFGHKRKRLNSFFSEPFKRFLAVLETLLKFASYIIAYYYLFGSIHTENCSFFLRSTGKRV